MSIFPERWMGRTIPTHNIPEHYIKDGKKYNTRTNEEVPKKVYKATPRKTLEDLHKVLGPEFVKQEQVLRELEEEIMSNIKKMSNKLVNSFDELGRDFTRGVSMPEFSKQCALIAEEFAIGFAEFIEGTYSYSNIFDHWYLHADTSKTYTKKQLLNQYKKQKGL